MTPAAPSRRGDAGTTLVDVVIGLFLTAVAGWLIATLLTDTARRTADGTIDFDAGLAADVFTRDVRNAESVDVVLRRGTLVALDLRHDDGVVRWELAGSSLTRRLPTDPSPQILLTDLAAGSRFDLRDSAGIPLDPGDTVTLQECTRLVVLDLIGDEGWTVTRTAAMRVSPEVEACP